MNILPVTLIAWGLAISMVAPAHAQQEQTLNCGHPVSEAVDQLAFKFGQGQIPFQEALEKTTAAADACPDNNFAQHYAGQVWQNVLNERAKQQGVQLNELLRIWQKAFGYNERFWAMPSGKRMAGYPFRDFDSLVVGRKRDFPRNQAYDVREALVQWALEFHTRFGATSSYVTRDAPEECPGYVIWDSGGLRDWAKNNPSHATAAIGVLERYVPVCPISSDSGARGLYRALHRDLAGIRLTAAKEFVESDPEQAHRLLQQVREYRDLVLASERVSTVDWSDLFKGKELREVEASLPLRNAVPVEAGDPLVSAGNVPIENWFDRSMPDEVVLESIGQTINAYTVELGSVGVVRAVGKIFALAKQSATPNDAFPLIYRAAANYKDGRYRSIETRDTRVFEVSYEWLKDYSI